MFGIGTTEFFVIILVGVLVLGPEHLPRIMRTFTKVMSDVRRVSTDFQRTVNLEVNKEEWEKKQAEEAQSKKKKKKKKVAAAPNPEPAEGETPKAPAQTVAGNEDWASAHGEDDIPKDVPLSSASPVTADAQAGSSVAAPSPEAVAVPPAAGMNTKKASANGREGQA